MSEKLFEEGKPYAISDVVITNFDGSSDIWPTVVFPAKDDDDAKRGVQLFKSHCYELRNVTKAVYSLFECNPYTGMPIRCLIDRNVLEL